MTRGTREDSVKNQEQGEDKHRRTTVSHINNHTKCKHSARPTTSRDWPIGAKSKTREHAVNKKHTLNPEALTGQKSKSLGCDRGPRRQVATSVPQAASERSLGPGSGRARPRGKGVHSGDATSCRPHRCRQSLYTVLQTLAAPGALQLQELGAGPATLSPCPWTRCL